MKESISSHNIMEKNSKNIIKKSIDLQSKCNVLLGLAEIIQECEKVLESQDVKSAQNLKTKILLDYEKYYYRAMNESLGKDIICEYDVYGEYDSEVLHIDRCYRLNHNKLFENLYILKTKITSLKKRFDKKPDIFL